MKDRHEAGALPRLRELSGLLANESDPARLVPLVLDQAIELVGAERGFVIVLEGRAKALEVAAARNLDREAIQSPELKVSRSIVKRVAKSGKAELIVDAEQDAATREIPSVQLLKLRSVLCVPLRAHGETLGVVYVDHRYTRGEFDAEDLETLEAFAVPAAIALDAARRRQELERGRAALEASRDELAQRVETIERLRLELAERYRERAREADRLRGESHRRGGDAKDAVEPEAFPGTVARSSAMKRVQALVRKVAPSDAPVLILGESGSGKELLARALHALSPRKDGPFLAENCAALAEPLLESELFGHEAGSFTGASATHRGLFETARGGTLLLDEVGDMTPGLQSKLLRVLQEREVRRVGGSERIAVDVRIVAATHRDLEAMVAAGTFRKDLYYRLNVVRVEVPPLRDRPEDVPALLDHFLERASRARRGREPAIPGPVFDPQARELLLAHRWPGNVRELENEVERLSLLAGPGGTIRPGLLSPAILGGLRPADADASGETDGEPPITGVWKLDALEQEMIARALRRARGNKTLAAKLLGIPKTSLYNRMGKGEGREP